MDIETGNIKYMVEIMLNALSKEKQEVLLAEIRDLLKK